MTSCELEDNTGDEFGGAIVSWNNTQVDTQNTTFKSNNAFHGGRYLGPLTWEVHSIYIVM